MKTRKQIALLDDTDWAILKILQENAKAKYIEIGKELKLAHSTVYDRIKKLEKHGIITKYTIAVDFRKTGKKILNALVTIFSDPKECEKIAEQIAKYPQVSEVLISLSEELAIIARITAQDQEMLHFFIARNIAPLKGVLRIRTSVITKKFKQENTSLSVDAITKLTTDDL